MRAWALWLLSSLATVTLVTGGAVGGELVPEDARPRVAYHLRQVDELARHFEGLIAAECPVFAGPAEWQRYLDGEIDRFVLLVAHVQQAWVEAKRTGDDEVRREAKAPRKRADRIRLLVGKLEACADSNRADAPTQDLIYRIEREVPRRQAEIALPR